MASRAGEGGETRQARGAGQSANGGSRRPRQAEHSRRGTGAREAERRLREAEMLLNVTRTVAGYETLDEVLGALMGMTTREVGAERSTLFLNDEQTGELYARVAQGNFQREIRILNTTGIAGHVFTEREGLIVHDAYGDDRFNRDVDEQTGFVTRSILCAPIRTVKGDVIGVAQALNKEKGRFTKDDLRVLESMTTQATIALQSTEFVERVRRDRAQEMEFLDIVSDVTSELDLGALLQKVMGEATRMLAAERSTLFLNDEKTDQLFSRVAQGDSLGEIRLPNTAGIAGAVFTSGDSVNIPHAYADLRFNPAFDKQTGFFTRSILCVPVVNKDGKSIGVTQILNKRGGSFTHEDETRLKAFTAQVSIALENAKLFDDVQSIKNYNESMLESMSNGVVTLNEDGKIVTCNAAGLGIMKVAAREILGQKADEFFADVNAWVIEKVARVDETQESEVIMDAEMEFGDETLSVNVTVLPLISGEQKKLGAMIMIEDISSEKRMKSTMSRSPISCWRAARTSWAGTAPPPRCCSPMCAASRRSPRSSARKAPSASSTNTSRSWSIASRARWGMLDKFIGDAIMAAFGLPIAHDDDEDRGVRAAIAMISGMWEWNIERAKNGRKPVDMGIGLNTDSVVSGNISSPKRMDYTLIGDGVNLAARLESACKQYAARILISENTFAKLRGTYRAREVDLVVVKGKTEPVGVYEVLDYHTPETFPNLMDVVNHFREGVRHYRAGDWNKGIAGFKEALAANPTDRLAQTYIERCEQLKKTPPKGEWDGVWVMTSK